MGLRNILKNYVTLLRMKFDTYSEIFLKITNKNNDSLIAQTCLTNYYSISLSRTNLNVSYELETERVHCFNIY